MPAPVEVPGFMDMGVPVRAGMFATGGVAGGVGRPRPDKLWEDGVRLESWGGLLGTLLDGVIGSNKPCDDGEGLKLD